MNNNEIENGFKGAVSGSFFTFRANDYSTFQKGKIYNKESIGNYLTENPKDWASVLDYPTSKELLDCFENGTNKTKIIKSLKQWQNYR